MSTGRCWTCRRRRLKCDGEIPSCRKCLDNGVACLGYVKPLTWVEGVSVRGPMKNRSFGGQQTSAEAKHTSQKVNSHSLQQPSVTYHVASSPDLPAHSDDELTCLGTDSSHSSPQASPGAFSSSHLTLRRRHNYSRSRYSPPPMIALTEPLFQDLDLASRFFIDYFWRDTIDNKYRGIIPLVASSPAVASAILAVASCHFTHGIMGIPILSLRSNTTTAAALDGEMPMLLSSPADVHLSKSTLLNHYLRSKADCLKHLAAALEDESKNQCHSTLVTIVLLTILEACESGAGSWTIHLEGAKRLLTDRARTQSQPWHIDSPGLVNDVSVFQTFGSSITRPGLLSSSFSTHIIQSMRHDNLGVSLVGCPSSIQSAVEFFSSQRQLDTGETEPPIDVMGLSESLRQIRGFDVESWAAAVPLNNMDKDTLVDLQHIGTIWKLGADIYASRIFANVTRDSTMPVPSVDDLVAKYPFPELEDFDLIKCVLWPTFIAGAACSKLEHREWALRVFERIWEVSLSANAKSAALVLVNLWKKQDLRNAQLSNELMAGMEIQHGVERDWLSELLSLEDAWLFL
ncbi:unnamed protein product [Clonostachys rhizophaga]|uniref:Zn(2)-C6 fungal-type domain-containing protein n=1 Tax=Clonostachys rhizophaga TaxID=160324 RepID=A0A9N9W2Q9_9HYPO|nr:unnamed protein product [Clonostachys rhizophaga]